MHVEAYLSANNDEILLIHVLKLVLMFLEEEKELTSVQRPQSLSQEYTPVAQRLDPQSQV